MYQSHGYNGFKEEDLDDGELTIVKRSDELDLDEKEVREIDNENKPPQSYNYHHDQHHHDQHQQQHKKCVVSGKKRGRPSGKGAAAKEWDDTEIFALIDLWGSQEILYNTKHRKYYNKEERDNALQEMRESLESSDIFATAEQISDKMTNLKCYYGSQKRQTEYFKQQYGAESRDYVSPWKFYNRLKFLNGHFLQRTSNPKRYNGAGGGGNDSQAKTGGTTRRIQQQNNEQCITYDLYSGSKISIVDPYSSTLKSIADPFVANLQKKQNLETVAFQQITPVSQQPQQTKILVSEPYSNSLDAAGYWGESPTITMVSGANGKIHKQQSQNAAVSLPVGRKKSEDECFCELMLKMLNQIPETEEKAMLKLQMQQKVIALRYREAK